MTPYVNEPLLKTFRTPGKCAICSTWSPQREAHHVWTRATGRLDVPINLVSLGGAWSCACHQRSQSYTIPRQNVVQAVAFREGLDYSFVMDRVPWLRRQPKEASLCLTCMGAGSVRVEKGWGFRRHECPICRGAGAITAMGEPWVEPARSYSWEKK